MNSSLPDVNNPEQLASWIANIEKESSRISQNEKLMMDLWEAQKNLSVEQFSFPSGWETEKAKKRAYIIMFAGFITTYSATTALMTVDKSHWAIFGVFPILWIIWGFLALNEGARWWRTYSSKRIEHKQKMAHLTTAVKIAETNFETHNRLYT